MKKTTKTTTKETSLFNVSNNDPMQITIKNLQKDVLLNPRNYRSFEITDKKYWKQFDDQHAKIVDLISITMKNNKDSKRLQEKIFCSKQGLKADKAQIQVMDLVNYLYGPENYKTFIEFYSHNRELVKLCETINELINNGTPLFKLKKYMNKYFVVVSGNTRVSVILDYYYRNKKELEADSSLEKKFPVVIIDYDYEELFNDDNLREHLEGSSMTSIMNIRNLFQIACDLLVISDNINRTEDINTKFLALGSIAQEMRDNYETLVKIDSLKKVVKNSDHVSLKLKVFNKMYNALGVKLNELMEGLLYKEVTSNVRKLSNSDIIKEAEYFKDGKYDTVLTKYGTKVMVNSIGRYCTTGSKQNYHISREISDQIFGIDITTGKVNNEEKFTSGMEYIVKQKQFSATPKAGSYVANALIKGFNGFDGYIKRGGHLEQKQVDEIMNQATENVEEYAANVSLTTLDELYEMIENDDEMPNDLKLKYLRWISGKMEEELNA